jgi:hypothetical protein
VSAVKGSFPRPALQLTALATAKRHFDWLSCYGPTSWDQYDFWANPVGRRAKRLYYRRSRVGLPLVAPFVLLDALAPRTRVAVRNQSRFPIADAHYAVGLCGLANLEGREWLQRAVPFLESLVEQRCPSEEEYCWGYPFDWETCFGTWRAGTPLITTTPYCYEAFAAAHDLTGSGVCLEIMESAGRFAFTRIHGQEVAPGIKASTYSPFDHRRVVNASAYRGFLLAVAGTRFGHPDWVAEARSSLAFVLRSQQPDGSWLYAMDGKDAFVDNFHTCFVLKNLLKTRGLFEEEFDQGVLASVRTGYEFYKSHLLDRGGLPIPFARAQRMTLQKRELYDYAEGIIVALLLADTDPDALMIARHLVNDLVERWVLPNGSFVTKQLLLGRNTVPYHRWAQSQAFNALVRYALFGKD